MSGVLLNKGQEYILDATFKNLSIPGNLYIGLMQNSVNPEPSENIGSGIIEVTGTDYSRVVLNHNTDWTRVNQVITAISTVFMAGMGGWNNVNGYFISTAISGNNNAIIAESFPLLKQGNVSSGVTRTITPSFELKDEGEAIEP